MKTEPGYSTFTGETKKESKREKFLRLGNRRLLAALEEIRLIENLLQNPYIYDVRNTDIDTIQKKLTDAAYRLGLYKKPEGFEEAKQINTPYTRLSTTSNTH